MAKLTKRTIDALSPTETDAIIWDDDLPGFGLRVKSSGVRTYLIQYRTRTGQSRRLALGRHGVLTPDEARQLAREKLSEVRRGGDPAGEIKEARKAPTLADLADRYTQEWATQRKKASSAGLDATNLRNHILPALGKKKVAAVTRRDIERLHALLGKYPDGTPSPVRANRVLALLSKMFGLAEEWGIIPRGTNPCRGLRKFKERRRERYLSPEEFERLCRMLDRMEHEGTIPAPMAALVRLLVLTGCRLGEIQKLRWDHVDFSRQCLLLPDSKTGAKTVLLSTPTIELLAQLPKATDNPHVIPGRLPGSFLVGIEHIWQRIRRAAGLEDVRLHDLRHSFASIMAGLGEGLPVIGKALGHTQASTTQRYAHLAADPVRRAVERAGNAIMGMMKGGSGEVVTLNPAQARRGNENPL